MTKERLKELIEQGGEVYDRVNDEIIKLNEKTCRAVTSYSSKIVDELEIMRGWDDFVYHDIANLTDDFEKVKWERKIYAKRTERFKPPMWKDIKRSGFSEPDYWFVFMHDNCRYNFLVYLKYEDEEKGGYITIWKDVGYAKESHKIFGEPATKENYEKACEIVRDLFKGEK